MSAAGTFAGLASVRQRPSTTASRGSRIPVVTLAMSACAIIVALTPSLQRLLVLDRDRAMSGEPWRISTGSLVHFSVSHLAWDLLVVAFAGAMLERSGRALLPVLALSSVAVGIAVLLFAPEVQRYGGLSGVAYSLVVLAALDGLTSSSLTRGTAVALLAIVAAKLAWERSTGGFLLVGDAGVGVVPVPIAHIAGTVAGFVGGRKSCRSLLVSVRVGASGRGPGSRS